MLAASRIGSSIGQAVYGHSPTICTVYGKSTDHKNVHQNCTAYVSVLSLTLRSKLF